MSWYDFPHNLCDERQLQPISETDRFQQSRKSGDIDDVVGCEATIRQRMVMAAFALEDSRPICRHSA